MNIGDCVIDVSSLDRGQFTPTWYPLSGNGSGDISISLRITDTVTTTDDVLKVSTQVWSGCDDANPQSFPERSIVPSLSGRGRLNADDVM